MKKILFVSGTRADFGKIKSLISICRNQHEFDVSIFVTGMHMHHKYGYTVHEIEKSGFDNLYKYINYTSESTMDLTLAKTIDGMSSYVKEEHPDLIVVHGDRVEALAGAIVGALNNILVAHIEGGEMSGTIDELIRHSVSKMSHSHFVSNRAAKKRLIQMGEIDNNIFVIGSPDIDIMFSDALPKLDEVLSYYQIPFFDYAIMMFHPVTTEEDNMAQASQDMVKAVLESGRNYIVIYPNNDLGSGHILRSYQEMEGLNRVKIFPSLRFEYFLTLLKNTQFVIGNSSAGIREAPYYGIPSINIGTRQSNRTVSDDIIHVDYNKESIAEGIESALAKGKSNINQLFGIGNSDILFKEVLEQNEFWNISKQKMFQENR